MNYSKVQDFTQCTAKIAMSNFCKGRSNCRSIFNTVKIGRSCKHFKLHMAIILLLAPVQVWKPNIEFTNGMHLCTKMLETYPDLRYGKSGIKVPFFSDIV